jgi:signal transduction histidine kinase
VTAPGGAAGAAAGATAERTASLPRFPLLTVPGWFRAVFAVIAVLVVGAGVIIFQLLGRSRVATAELTNAVLPAQAQAYRLQAALLDQETGVRGFGITGDPSFLQPYTAGLATETDAASRLLRLIGHDQRLSADLRGIEQAADAWRRSFALPLIALARHGPLNGKDIGLLDSSKRSFDQLRVRFARQNADLAVVVAHDSSSAGRSRGINNLSFTLILVVFLLASLALALVLHNAVVRPLGRLRADSRRVVDGDFGHRIEATGPADLRAVAADVDAMRGELLTSLEGARAAQEITARQAADLDDQAEELRRSNAELEQFAYVASHDLQEPLRKVASFCQLLEKRYGDQLDERGRQYIGFAVDGAKRLQVLINDLLTFSRVGRAGDDRFRLPVPLDGALDSAISAVSAAIAESAAVIERPQRLPEVTGDATLLAMMWQNLISNGIKFRSPGRAPVVRITVAEHSGGMWLFCVEDNGIGIAPEFAEKVFVIFQRLHGRDAYPGTGIGLALCKRIVEHHGGEISLDATYAEGTRICFSLPRIVPAGPDRVGQDLGAASVGASRQDASRATAEGIPE